MNTRLNYYHVSPAAVKAMMELEGFVKQSGLDQTLLNLVKLRASQINGCAYCVDLHSSEAKKSGETERRMNALSVWQEAPFFTEKERAALAWTEAVTLLSQTHVPDAIYQEIKSHFTEKEIVDLTMAIVTINGWNRLAVSFRMQPK